MSAIDQIDIDELADADAPLDEDDMEALLAGTADDRIRFPATKWLEAYRLTRWLGLSECPAQLQAGAAWDRAANDIAIATAVVVVEAN